MRQPERGRTRTHRQTIAQRLEAEAKRPVPYEEVEPWNEWILPDREHVNRMGFLRPWRCAVKRMPLSGGDGGRATVHALMRVSV